MILSPAPVTFTTKPFSVDLQKELMQAPDNRPCEIKLQNQSPLPLLIKLGGDEHLLPGQMADLFCAPKSKFGSIAIEPQAIAPAPVSGSGLQSGPAQLVASPGAAASVQPGGTFALLITIGFDGDHIPGTFPCVLAPIAQIQSVLLNPSVVVAVASSSGQAVVNVPDTSPFLVGGYANLLTQGGIGPSQLVLIKAVSPAAQTITVAPNLKNALAAGDVVQSIPLNLASNRKRAWDWWSSQSAAQGVGYQVILAGVSGIRHILNHLSTVIVNTNGAAATGVTETVRDGSSAGVILWQTFTGIQGVTGDKDRIEAADMGAAASVGNALYAQQENNIANTSSSVAINGYEMIAEPV